MTPTTAQSLYRTWRSRTFEEVVGQGHITQTLRNAVRGGSVGHAYLLTGPRGTGKTSTARILARAVNCLQPRDGEPCNVCAPCQSILQNRCLDVMEIDAASKSKVDEMRDVIDKVGYAPTEVRRKVYVVDEVHMLSAHAFNALLKTIEEPPAHAIFLLATTDVHKVPTTITSRCQRLDFRTISMQDIVERLAYVCEQEGLQAERAALEVIAQQATGSLRDALSLLEQVRAYEDASIDVAAVEDALGLARGETLVRLADYIIAGDAGGALTLIVDLSTAGSDMRQYSKQLVEYWRDLLLMRVGASRRTAGDESNAATAAQAARLSPADITAVLKAILQPDYSGRRSASAQTQLELAVVEASARFSAQEARPAEVGVNGAQSSGAASAPVSRPPVTPVATAPRPVETPDAAATRVRPPTAGRVHDRVGDPGSVGDLPIPAREGRTPGTGEQRGERPALPDRARALSSAEPTGTTGEAVGQARPLEEAPARRPGTAPGVDAPAREATRRAASVDRTMPAAVDEPAHEQHQPAPGRLDPRDVWARVRQHPSVKGRARLNALLLDDSCVPGSEEDGVFVLLFDGRNKFRQEQIMAQQNRAVIEEALGAVVGRPVTLRCDTLRQQSPEAPTAERDPTSDTFVDDAARRLRAIHISR